MVRVLPSDMVLRGRTAILRACQSYVQKVVNMARLTLDIVDCFRKWDKDGAEQLFIRMRELEDLLHEDRGRIIESLASAGAMLPCRDDVMRFLYQISEIADFYEGAVFRMIQLMKGQKLPARLRESIARLADEVGQIVEKLHEVAMALTMNPVAARTLISEVESLEREIDMLYREIEMKILEENLKLKTIFLARDVVKFFEDAADKVLDAADTARILAMAL
ncbi:hypothetical protein B6U66_05405 [Candidatus Bathyarchaeota archaeon ex4484_135]|nr:MAG: hypothetical protein B6U66_05405 [Candidatus Bathyarchaeota archaeon ex4484_135]